MTPNLLFVYGTLRKGQGNHGLLNSSTLVSEDKVNGFNMHSLGGFPGCVPGDGKVLGEVYEVVDKHMWQALDRLEGHPTFFKREVLKTVAGSDVWMYVLQYDTERIKQLEHIKEGDWVSYAR